MYGGCPSWREIYRKSGLMFRYWVDALIMFFQAKLGRIWYAPWIPLVEVILLTYILIGIPSLAVLVGALLWSFLVFAFIRVSMARMSSSLWRDWERYIRCSRPVVMLLSRIDRVISYFRSGYIDEACMGAGIIFMIYVAIIIGIVYSLMYPGMLLLYIAIMVLGMFISSSLGF